MDVLCTCVEFNDVLHCQKLFVQIFAVVNVAYIILDEVSYFCQEWGWIVASFSWKISLGILCLLNHVEPDSMFRHW